MKRMLDFEDWPPDSLRSITAPALIIVGDADVVRPEHAVEMFRLIPNAPLAIVPDMDHMRLVKETEAQVRMIEAFLR